jgi:hypothetical protein
MNADLESRGRVRRMTSAFAPPDVRRRQQVPLSSVRTP